MEKDINISQAFLDSFEKALVRRKLNAEALCDITKLSAATISRLRKGRASERTLAIVCEGLEINRDGSDAVKINIYGYSGANEFDFYKGTYLWIRPIFDDENLIGCYPVEIFRNKGVDKLEIRRFVSDRRMSLGDVYINNRGYINIVSALGGFVSLTTISSIDEDGLMFGAMLCLGEFSGNMVAPTCAPVVFIRVDEFSDKTERIVIPDDEDFKKYRALLQRVHDKKFAVFKCVY